MHDLTLWFIPLALLLAVVLLAHSTANRYALLRTESDAAAEAQHQRRSGLLRTARVGLYLSIVLLAGALLAGALFYQLERSSTQVILPLTGAAILALIYATLQLIRETLLDRN